MKLLAELQALLESYDPRRLLLQVQQLLVDAYPRANIELESEYEHNYSLKLSYFDIPTITFQLYKEDEDGPWMTASRGRSATLHPVPFDEHRMKPYNIFESLEILLRTSFEECAVFEDNCDQWLAGDTEKWVYSEIGKLFKYLDEGRLKKATDVHVVVSPILDNEGLQKLETRYNSSLINMKKLRTSSLSAPSADDAKLIGREVYILAALE